LGDQKKKLLTRPELWAGLLVAVCIIASFFGINLEDAVTRFVVSVFFVLTALNTFEELKKKISKIRGK
jgi:divalent metal cation (Fe/Co/Zn/Cd) transporter